MLQTVKLLDCAPTMRERRWTLAAVRGNDPVLVIHLNTKLREILNDQSDGPMIRNTFNITKSAVLWAAPFLDDIYVAVGTSSHPGMLFPAKVNMRSWGDIRTTVGSSPTKHL
jgi:hypothetical protein